MIINVSPSEGIFRQNTNIESVVMTPIKGYIVPSFDDCCSCGAIGFRGYFAYKNQKMITVAIRHFTKHEVRHGLAWYRKPFWVPMVIQDPSHQGTCNVYVNKNSLLKRLAAVGHTKASILQCIASRDLSPLKLNLVSVTDLKTMSPTAFWSHGPLC